MLKAVHLYWSDELMTWVQAHGGNKVNDPARGKYNVSKVTEELLWAWIGGHGQDPASWALVKSSQRDHLRSELEHLETEAKKVLGMTLDDFLSEHGKTARQAAMERHERRGALLRGIEEAFKDYLATAGRITRSAVDYWTNGPRWTLELGVLGMTPPELAEHLWRRVPASHGGPRSKKKLGEEAQREALPEAEAPKSGAKGDWGADCAHCAWTVRYAPTQQSAIEVLNEHLRSAHGLGPVTSLDWNRGQPEWAIRKDPRSEQWLVNCFALRCSFTDVAKSEREAQATLNAHWRRTCPSQDHPPQSQPQPVPTDMFKVGE